MITTHIFAGSFLGLVVGERLGLVSLQLVLAGIVGSVVPDLDMLAGTHRRSLHFPVLGTVTGLVVLGLTASLPGAVVGTMLCAVGLHAIMDWLGNGKELRPWERTDDRATYDHVRGRWWAAKRYVETGSTRDLALGVLLALPLTVWAEGLVRVAVIAGVGVSVLYGLGLPYLADRIPDTHTTWSGYLAHHRNRLWHRLTG